MPDKKISQLTGGGAAQATDEFPIARSGGNNKITGANVAAAATSVGTLTSLTVSGNVTVDTDTLFVNAGNNRVGIGTNAPITLLHVAGQVHIQPSTANNALITFRHGSLSASNYIEGRVNSSTVFGTANADRMTLDSSGNLGLGVTPSSASARTLQFPDGVTVSNAGAAASFAHNAVFNSGWKYVGTGAATLYQKYLGAHAWFIAASGTAGNAISFTQRMLLTAAGNLGIGVTPSAFATVNAVQVSHGSLFATTSAAHVGSNVFFDGSYKYIGSDWASRYQQFQGVHSWYTAPSGTAGATISFTQAMTLDASGNLGLGVTPSSASARTLQFPGGVTVSNAGTAASFAHNAVFNSGWKYVGTGAATLYQKYLGAHAWFIAASGTAGNAISFTQAMTLDANGNLGVGLANPGARLHVRTQTNGNLQFQNSVYVSGGVLFNSVNDAANANVPLDLQASSIQFAISGTERARITSAGNVVMGGSVALATTATDGFLYVPTCAGTPTGTPTSITGMAPIVVDTTNNKLYFYSNAAWRDAGP